MARNSFSNKKNRLWAEGARKVLQIQKPPNRHQMSLRDLSQISIERDNSDLLEMPQKRSLFCDVFKTSRVYLKKDAFPVTSLRRFGNTYRKYL